MRIGLVSPYDLERPGGVQRQVLDLAGLLRDRGEESVVIGPGASTVGGISVGRVVAVRANRSVVPLAMGFGAFRQLRRAAAGLDVLHVHEPLIPMVGPAALRAGRPVVATFHALPPGWAARSYRAIPRAWFRGAVLTAVSEQAASAPSRLGEVEIIPNGIDLTGFAGDGPRRPHRVVFVGRDEPRKGLRLLLEAWPAVREAHPEADLIVIGTAGSSREGLQFVGRVSEDQKRAFLSTAAILAAPNLGSESFGVVLVEGMAAGCAVVASDIPGFREVASGAAELIRPGRADLLAATISGLLGDPTKVGVLRTAGWQRAAMFDWSRVLPRYLACYQRAAGGKTVLS
ncbi:MAG TPA: glycosyltransferase family 4 protein [Acidimicrobiia bacterium]|nr:glycosyltransferase family 4 protein [Acidimicrobiia bacterium]